MVTLLNARNIRKSFLKFLESRGAEILKTTNQYEVLRFRCAKGVGVVYKNNSDSISYVNSIADEAYRCFKMNGSWVGTPSIKKASSRNVKVIKTTLFERDGDSCFFCGSNLTFETATVEHLFALTHGGKNHIANLVLSCEGCQAEAGNSSIIEKVKIRERNLFKKNLIHFLTITVYYAIILTIPEKTP